MPLAHLWEDDDEVREIILLECIDVLSGGGPKPIRQSHLACVVDWALRERHRGDELERVLEDHIVQSTQALKKSHDLTGDMAKQPKRNSPLTH